MTKSKHTLKFLPLLLTLLLPLLSACASSQSLPEITDENLTVSTITIPGISREYNLLFLTDTHIVLPDESTGEIRDYSAERLSHFTNDSGYISSELFSSWMEYANRTKPDALLLGGDIIDSPSPANLEFLDASLSKLNIPYLYTVGNHDWTYPWEYMTETGTAQYLPLLAPYMENNTAIHTLETEDFVLVAVDNSSNQIHPDSLEEYRQILSKGKPVIVLLHVPLYTGDLFAKTSGVWTNGAVLGGGVPGGIYPNDISAEFISLTTAADSPVAAIIAGHVHLPDESAVDGEKNIPQIVGDAGYKGKGMSIRILPAGTAAP